MRSTVLCELAAAPARPPAAAAAAGAADVVAEGRRIAADMQHARDADQLRQQGCGVAAHTKGAVQGRAPGH
eukprot:gene8129-494_t